MKFCSLFILFILAMTPAQSQKGKQGQPGLDHSAWDGLLQDYVTPEGKVDYPGFSERKAELEAYLRYLGDHKPGAGDSRNEVLAFYINLYNVATIHLILENYPLKSIRDLENPWGEKRIRLDGEKVSLNKIEHGILRKINEPRIHFAINCASVSCPKLRNRAFTAKGMELELQQAAMDFINDPGRNRITEDTLLLSAIFKWYRGDFMQKRSLVSYLQPFTRTKLKETAGISYLPYDWNLNE